MKYQEIIHKLPYTKPFLFVDELLHIDENGAEGSYTFDADSDFYKGHFKDNPVTPGVILTECCAQIGVVALGIYLLNSEEVAMGENVQIGLSSSEMEFLAPVFPNEKVVVTSEKEYFRFHKLKCKVKMHNSEGKLVCKGTVSGMLKSIKNG
ncbi:3-hydroxyacyl-ACP dehydratase FabZ family protein [Maribacter sp. 2308TA10-17]|uniref:3-hydroxyacyl-ACP dehydratase FabZ family protein n=1 Tax=Maribacter sp. 2308TA10-17 TaxID=3386276 RepID=UPI0039BD1583